MPCDLDTIATTDLFIVCDDDRFRGLVQLMNCLVKKGRRREAKLIYRRIATLLNSRGVAGERPFFSLEDGSTCRLAGNGRDLYFVRSGTQFCDCDLVAHQDMNAVDLKRFPRSPIQKPSLFHCEARSKPSGYPETSVLENYDRSKPISIAAIRETCREVVPC